MNNSLKLRLMGNNVKRDVRIADRASLMLSNYTRHAPDVLCLQECDALAYETVVEPFVTENFSVAGTAVEGSGEMSRTPILYRNDKFELVEQASAFFTHRYTNSKTYSIAVLQDKASGKCFAVINVHFAIIIGRYPKEIGTDAEVGNQWRIGNAKQLLAVANGLRKTYGDIPIFLTGDFNSTCREEPYRVLSTFFTDTLTNAREFCSRPIATFHAVGKEPDSNGLPLDYIFVTDQNTDVLRSEIVCDSDMLNSTDHCAVIADLVI